MRVESSDQHKTLMKKSVDLFAVSLNAHHAVVDKGMTTVSQQSDRSARKLSRNVKNNAYESDTYLQSTTQEEIMTAKKGVT